MPRLIKYGVSDMWCKVGMGGPGKYGGFGRIRETLARQSWEFMVYGVGSGWEESG